MPSKHKIIEEFGLARKKSDRAHHGAYRFMVSAELISCNDRDDWSSWSSFSIFQGYSPIHTYTLSLSAQTYVIQSAFLQDEDEPSKRYTECRLWQMVVDSWLSAKGAPETLRYIGVHHIVNPFARAAMQLEFGNITREKTHRHYETLEGKKAQRITLTPATADYWTENPFTRCGIRVAKALGELSAKNISLKNVSCICLSEVTTDKDAVFHMVLELGE